MSKWWDNSVGYIIYPQSFKDSNEDGIGDIKGIIEKLDYLAFLGVNLLWIGPLFDSVNPYNGYDTVSFLDIAPRYGNLEDLKLLIDEAHRRNIRILLDFPLNHTSIHHPWFKKAMEDPSSPERSFYHIVKGKKEGRKTLPPNNWRGFSGKIWEKIKGEDNYYLHVFSKDIPDLNWDNPEVRKRMCEAMNFYLDLGADGFRLDALAHLAKDTSYEDSSVPLGKDGLAFDTSKYSNRPELFDYLKYMKDNVFSKHDCLIVGEVGGSVTPETALRMASYRDGSINMVFNFDTVWNNGNYMSIEKKDEQIVTDVVSLKYNFLHWYDILHGKADMPLYWCNHDHPRVLSQYGSKKYREESAKMLLTTILFLYGNDFIYFGDEIGMGNAEYETLDDYLVDKSNYPEIASARKDGYSDSWILHYLNRTSRVNSRTPMQWNGSKDAGFGSDHPLYKVNGDCLDKVNVEEQLKDYDSILHFYKYAIGIRKDLMINEQVLHYDLHFEDIDNPDVFAYYHDGLEKIMVISNMREKEVRFPFYHRIRDILLHNYDEVRIEGNELILAPFESYLIRI